MSGCSRTGGVDPLLELSLHGSLRAIDDSPPPPFSLAAANDTVWQRRMSNGTTNEPVVTNSGEESTRQWRSMVVERREPTGYIPNA